MNHSPTPGVHGYNVGQIQYIATLLDFEEYFRDFNLDVEVDN